MVEEYFSTELGRLYLGDALEFLRGLPDESVDLVLTDPPYNISHDTVITREGGKFGKAKPISMDFGEWDKGQVKWQHYVPEFARVLRRGGVLVMFYDRLYIGIIGLYLQNRYGFRVRHIGAAVKNNPTPQARKVKWMIGTELFLVATKGSGHHFNWQLGQSPDYYIHSVSFKPRYHPTQKHLGLIEWIMKYWSFEGDLVVDPFIGSGTTAVAAERLGRRWLGCDNNREYLDMAVKRLRPFKSQTKLEV